VKRTSYEAPHYAVFSSVGRNTVTREITIEKNNRT